MEGKEELLLKKQLLMAELQIIDLKLSLLEKSSSTTAEKQEDSSQSLICEPSPVSQATGKDLSTPVIPVDLGKIKTPVQTGTMLLKPSDFTTSCLKPCSTINMVKSGIQEPVSLQKG